jgi:soluble lytic murein transglycosylase
MAMERRTINLIRRWKWRLVFTAMAIFLSWKSFFWWREGRYDKEILAASRRYTIKPGLVKAVVWKESRFRENAVGTVGEIGLMQIRQAAFQEWLAAERMPETTISNLYNPTTNLMAGTWYLKKLMGRYQTTDNPAAFALADYNAGRKNVLRWKKDKASTNSEAFFMQMDFPTTRSYIRQVLEQAEEYGNWGQ